MPFYNPIILARRLATLDALAARRLRVGLGQAWSADELEAAGAPPGERGSRADEFLGVVKVMWADDPVEFRGKHFRVALDEGLAPSGAPPRGRRARSMNPTTRRRLSCLTSPRPRFDHRADTALALARGW